MHPKYLQIVQELNKEFPNFEVLDKQQSTIMKLIYTLTFMKYWNDTFMTKYTTVMFGKVYTQKSLIGTETLAIVLKHERVHLRDARKYPILFELSYLFLLPTVFTFRAFWEFRAYKETLRCFAEERDGKISHRQVDWVIGQFTSSKYLWMFPFKNFLKKKIEQFMIEENISYIEE